MFHAPIFSVFSKRAGPDGSSPAGLLTGHLSNADTVLAGTWWDNHMDASILTSPPEENTPQQNPTCEVSPRRLQSAAITFA